MSPQYNIVVVGYALLHQATLFEYIVIALFTYVTTAMATLFLHLFPVHPQTFAHPNRRLELRFRPQDPFCHSLCGNRLSSSNLLLKVRRRVRKNNPKDAEIHMDILGVIGTTYKFQG